MYSTYEPLESVNGALLRPASPTPRVPVPVVSLCISVCASVRGCCSREYTGCARVCSTWAHWVPCVACEHGLCESVRVCVCVCLYMYQCTVPLQPSHFTQKQQRTLDRFSRRFLPRRFFRSVSFPSVDVCVWVRRTDAHTHTYTHTQHRYFHATHAPTLLANTTHMYTHPCCPHTQQHIYTPIFFTTHMCTPIVFSNTMFFAHAQSTHPFFSPLVFVLPLKV